MALLRFEDQYPMFDVTPVDNQFILEYLPAAKGEDVKVYLYGLMQCYHPQAEMTIEQMARDLHLTEEAVHLAMRRWERKGLVRRISDQPAQYVYQSVKRQFFMGTAPQVDPEYEAFAQALAEAFGEGRHLHGKDTALCYEWVEEMHLSPEVVIALIEHMIDTHGKSFRIDSAQKLAIRLAEEKCETAEDAREILGRDKAVYEGARKVLRKLGKRRPPSEDELDCYRTWTTQWGFSLEAVLAACKETVKGDPNFAYLGGILQRHHQQYGQENVTGAQMDTRLQEEKDAVAPLKALVHVLNLPVSTINEGTKSVYAEMREMYDDAIILMAGRECARHGGTLDEVAQTLRVWKHQGLQNQEEITAYMAQVEQQNGYVQMLMELWGRHDKPKHADRTLVKKWKDDWKLTDEFIVTCAPEAAQADKPMAYLDKIMENLYRQGKVTPEEARANTGKKPDKPARQGKVVREQQYTQREYVHTEEELDRFMAEWEDEGDA